MAIVTHFYHDDNFISAVGSDVNTSGVDYFMIGELELRIRKVELDVALLVKRVILTHERPAARPE